MITSRNTTVLWGLMMGVMVLLSGCSRQFRYEAKPLPTLNSYNAQFEETQQSVVLLAQTLDYQDGKELFNGNGTHLYGKDALVPVQLCIENNSGNAWTINPEQISLERASFHQIKKQVQNNTAGRVATIVAVGTLLAAPAIIVGGIFLPSAMLLGPSLVALSAVAVGGGVAATAASTSVAVYEGYRSCAQNISIEEDIRRVTLLNDLVIQPGKKISKLIFVPQERFESSFTVTLINPANELDQLNFDVTLKNQTPEH